ncbi:MAG TPA: cyanophycin synthetase [Candidatus Thermoplasmatota archaeon]|nr:cyanophycin synthetase [Candidatus Thermoplasmatota archaeon]
MNILEHRALTGPNHHSPYPTIHMVLDIHPYEDVPSNRIDGFPERLLGLLPSLAEHRCSRGRPGGFVERLHEGTWMGHIVEHVAIELQCLAGMKVGFGKTRETDRPGIYTIAYRYRDAEAGIEAGRIAVELVEAMAAGEAYDVGAALDDLKRMRAENMLGPSTDAIVKEAKRRGIPVIRLNRASYIQLGYGKRQQRLQASLTGRTSCIGAEIADDKDRTKEILHDAGIPVPRGEVAASLEEAIEIAEDIGYPVVLKPRVGNHGRGVTTNIRTEEELVTAFELAREHHRHVVVEQHLEGSDFRVLVVNHRFVAAARRDPAAVTGDGKHTVAELVDITNADPRRGHDHDNVLTRIQVDDASLRLLAAQGLTLGSVPEEGRLVRLKGTANLSTGGTATDVTAEVHPHVRRACERASRLIGLDLMGLDIVAPHLRQPLQEVRGGIVEVNAAPGLRMHAYPTNGRPRNVGAPILDMLFPDRGNGRIPIVAVTGTNGKTTTARLTAHILARNGGTVGLATTSGVEIDGESIVEGDYSGPDGARTVLTDPAVDHAVLEVARGGILRRGLGFDQCDVGIFLNVASDHLGEGGINTIEDLAELKSVVVENVARTGTAVLNADDPHVVRYADGLRAKVTLFSMDSESPILAQHVARAGTVVTLADNQIVVRDGGGDDPVLDVRDIPITLGGAARFNIQNAMAAVAACRALGVPTDAIRDGLQTFEPSPQQLPGRLNLVEVGDYRVLVDYGHNVPALQALAPVVRALTRTRAIVMANGSGNRRDEDLRAFGCALAGMYEEVVLCDPDPRRRTPGETMRLVREGAEAGGLPASRIHCCDVDEAEAIRRAFAIARAGDLLVLQVSDIRQALQLVERERQARLPPQPPQQVVIEAPPAIDATLAGDAEARSKPVNPRPQRRRTDTGKEFPTVRRDIR